MDHQVEGVRATGRMQETWSEAVEKKLLYPTTKGGGYGPSKWWKLIKDTYY